MATPLSILDLAPVAKGQTAGQAIAASVALAQTAERTGYERVWYAEHHNMAAIASSATSVLIAHVAANTTSIKLGAGGVMLPNHSPLVIAEQFGTLAEVHPGRIELGLGRAPGSDQATTYALRRDPATAENFPQDVVELQGFLAGESKVRGVQAIPGKNTRVPLYILGSSLFGAQLAAALGLPYAFASHFAPSALQDAVAIYRRDFKPSAQLDHPHVLAALNVIATDTTEQAQAELRRVKIQRVGLLYGRGRTLTEAEAEQIVDSGQAVQLEEMTKYTAAGTPGEVKDYLEQFKKVADADELIVAFAHTETEGRLRSVELTAEVMGQIK
ncbi:LLM class flavin-dependent oxidoreductase [Kineosporia rhizophila]|uniref:LLM class flavin-dependent oxidoreductase n=1 Tax=Kineosporia TaxID=49184 RepID=UPI001E3E6BF6|nr:LLM class flavin-dependent oxidoreductase [Kineosporia sp. NBRC 101677]MCE0537094.1 LLM class flavin-dependent oxidoreductase [Kineosporia rhizophila]GLY16061.1 putative luciferase-like protein [Kineosporia sp. NBRC 101677]